MVSSNTKIIAISNPNSIIADQYRSLLTNIRLLNKESNLKSILVTSPSPNEGKTTTIVNLAVTLAAQNTKVLIIDANLKRPEIHKHFNLYNNLGLIDLLMDESRSLKEVIQETDIKHLHVVTSGLEKLHQIDSNSFQQLLTSLYSTYDVIYIDSPALLESSITKVLGNHCEGVVLVITKGQTKLKETLAAKKELHFIKEKVLGVILNSNGQNIIQKTVNRLFKK